MDRVGDPESASASAPAATEVLTGADGSRRPVDSFVRSEDTRLLVSQFPEGFDISALFAIADALPLMIAYCGPDLRYRFVNRPLAEWMRVDRSALLGRTVEDVMGAAAYAARRPLLERALAGEAQWFAADYDHPTRGHLTTQADYIPHLDEAGEVVGLTMIVQDVTEQRIAGQALSESETRFRRIADGAPVPMWVARLDGHREFVNQAYADFFKMDKAAAAAIRWSDRLHPGDAEAMREAVAIGLKSRAPFEFEARICDGDDRYRWVQAMVQPRRNSDGDIVGYIGCANDVTLAKEAEQQLRAEVAEQGRELADRDARLAAMFDTIETAILLLTPDGTIIEANDRRTNWRPDGSAGEIGVKLWQTPSMQAFPEEHRALRRMVEKAAAGQTVNAEATLEKDGRPFAYLSTTVQPIFGEDREVRYLLLESRDLGELRLAQDQLRQAQKMEALGQLTGGIAHDFNNLLTVVVGGLDLISRRVADEKLKRYADNALAAAQRGARLTGQLLTFSRVQKLEVRSVRLRSILDEIAPMFSNAMGGRCEIEWDIESAEERLLADPTQLEVALLNLAINARDAMGGGGKLTVSTRRVPLSGDAELPSGDYLELAIADTGSGMPPEVLERVFEPFFTTKEVGKGTGLGLSMVYGMVRQSGGTARIDSVVGEGTTVRLFFQIAGDEVAGPDTAFVDTATERSIRGRKILVIDDDEDVRTFVTHALEDLGADVRGAADGSEGLEAYAEETPELIVLDFAMPGLSGADVAAAILADTPEQPILFISGYSETAAIRKVAPDAPLLAKPFSPRELEERLCALLPD